MTNLDRIRYIDPLALSGEAYFASLLQTAFDCGLFSDANIEDIQMQCIKLLAQKVQDFTGGGSSSVRVETAESIMKSNLYVLGLYLKTLPDADLAATELKTAAISDLYQKGRKIMHTKLGIARNIYRLAQKNRLTTPHVAYNATLGRNGLGRFFQAYNPDYSAHEIPAALDYPLANPITGLAGIEYIHKYLESIYLENEFCRHFAAENIEHLLYGFNQDFTDLPVNIFEQALTAAIGCVLANRNPLKLDITEAGIACLRQELTPEPRQSLASIIGQAAVDLLGELQASGTSLRNYIERSLPKIILAVELAVRNDSLGRVFFVPVNPKRKQKIEFISGVGMSDEEYRILISELMACRYSSDKLALIKQKVKSFGDFEDVLNDAQLDDEEIIAMLGVLGEVEIAALLRRHPEKPEVQAFELSAAEETIQLCLKKYLDQLPAGQQEAIREIARQLLD